MISRRRDLAFPASQRSATRGRVRDLLLSAVFIACGPVLWSCGATILREQPGLANRFGQMRDLSEIGTAETLLGLLAAGSGLIVSIGAGVAALAVISQLIARRCGAWRMERLLAQCSPGFLRRSATLALGAGLVLTASAADAWPRAAATETVSESQAGATGHQAGQLVGDSARNVAAGEPDSALFDVSESVDAPRSKPDAADDRGASSSSQAPNSDRLRGQPQRQVPEPEQVVVRLGDCLWDIVADHLGPDATDWEIAASWPGWYEANRDRIGADPGVILPGTILDVPTR